MGVRFWGILGLLALIVGLVVLWSVNPAYRDCEFVRVELAGPNAAQARSSCDRIDDLHVGALVGCGVGGLLFVGAAFTFALARRR
jgi:hypothetical protein